MALEHLVNRLACLRGLDFVKLLQQVQDLASLVHRMVGLVSQYQQPVRLVSLHPLQPGLASLVEGLGPNHLVAIQLGLDNSQLALVHLVVLVVPPREFSQVLVARGLVPLPSQDGARCQRQQQQSTHS